MPANPETVAAFIADLSQTRKLSTLRRYLATISSAHTRADHHFDRHDRAIRMVMAGLREEKGDDVRRVLPLTADMLRAMSFDDTAIGIRDKALLYLGIASGCRRSELAGLDWAVSGAGSGYIREDDRGVVLVLLRTKTGAGKPQEVAVPHGPAVEALYDWAALADLADGEPVFRSIRKGGAIQTQRLSTEAVARVVKQRCKVAGMDGGEFSGHSLRAGLITSAAEAGVERDRIKRHSRHKSDAILEGYVRIANRFKDSVVEQIGL
jgi:integrase